PSALSSITTGVPEFATGVREERGMIISACHMSYMAHCPRADIAMQAEMEQALARMTNLAIEDLTQERTQDTTEIIFMENLIYRTPVANSGTPVVMELKAEGFITHGA
ncbi:hypothetical protein MJO29_007611, partial [Puccinia striiformis f. sp. tritici]